MNAQYVLRSDRDYRYFVQGSGFTAGTEREATKINADALQSTKDCLKNAGLGYSTAIVVKSKSFAVNYIRLEDIRANGEVRANDKNPSRRRFSTQEEAEQHGSRFKARKAAGSDVVGSAGHIGFYVTETTDPVNATINWATGLTNAI